MKAIVIGVFVAIVICENLQMKIRLKKIEEELEQCKRIIFEGIRKQWLGDEEE